jgi:23S rRNA pseudouridine1911/1915/1917 synthase
LKLSKSIISTETSSETLPQHLYLEADADILQDIGHDGGQDFESNETREFVCSEAQHGQRVDNALVQLVSEFSRSYLKQLIEQGSARLNGQTIAKVASKVKVGDLLAIDLQATPQSQAFKPEKVDFEVIFEDEHLLIINKPVGLVVHPAPGNWCGTLLNGLLERDPKAVLLPRAGIVHRLDKDTSGLMVVARTRLVMDALVEKIAAREVNRLYLALGNRTWAGPKERDVSESIGRDPRNRLRMAVVSLDKTAGKTAKTSLKLLQNCDQGCLVLCRLHTGRTHQIRVHMAHIGHPLVADSVYGGAQAAGMLRQALHAEQLVFEHPVTGQAMHFAASLPQDFRLALTNWGLSYNGASTK